MWFDGGVDGPVEIELDHDASHPRRSSTRDDAGGDTDDGPGSETQPSTTGRTAALVVAAMALLFAGFALGRSGDGRSPDDAADAGAATSTSSTTDRPTTTTTIDRALVPLPPPESDTDSTTPGAPPRVGTISLPADSDGGLVPVRTRGTFRERLAPGPTGLVLVGITTDGDFAEIDLDASAYEITSLPEMAGPRSIGDAYVLAARDVTIVGSNLGPTGQYIVSADGTTVASTDLGELVWSRTRAPGPNEFWIQRTDDVDGHQVSFIRFDVATQQPVGDPVELPSPALQYGLSSDGTGRLLLFSPSGGTYVVGHDERRRLSVGSLMAVGPGHILVYECDERLVCEVVLIDSASGERRPTAAGLADVIPAWYYGGGPMLAPDGSAVVRFGFSFPWQTDPGGQWVLVDVDSGGMTPIGRPSRGTGFDPAVMTIAWSADSRFVVFLDGHQLAIYDRETDTESVIHPDLPELVSFDARP